jgi:hypothetical protein
MIFRFFVVLYIIATIAIAGWVVFDLVKWVHPSEIRISTYQAKCLHNNEYVVLQGGDTPYLFDEKVLNEPLNQTEETLNFYCKYYDQIQPHIQAYLQSSTYPEKYRANLAFLELEESLDRKHTSNTPALYSLETVREENNFLEVLFYLGGTLLWGLIGVLFLQVLRIVYLYIAFGEIIWHPFRKPGAIN